MYWIEFLIIRASHAEELLHNNIAAFSRGDSVVLVQGLNVYGERIYAYLKLDAIMFYEVRRKLEIKDKFNLRDYGEIVAAGQGNPNYDVRMEVEREYHMLPFDKKE